MYFTVWFAGERLIRHRSDNLAIEVLINPQSQTVKDSLKAILTQLSPVKAIIYAGYAFQGTAAWVVQDELFTFTSFNQVGVAIFMVVVIIGFVFRQVGQGGCALPTIYRHAYHCSLSVFQNHKNHRMFYKYPVVDHLCVEKKNPKGCLMSPSCLESQGCHLIPLCYLLSCSSA